MSSLHRSLKRRGLSGLRMPSSWYPPTLPFPEGLVWMWDATSWATSPVGPDISYSYAGDLQVDGVNIGPNPAIFPDKGLLNTTAITNLFQTLATEIVTLTAQDYVLQVFGTGSATCSYGTATVGSPLVFTAIAGSVTFTPTGIANWMLTEGSYVQPELAVGTSQVSTAGSASDNGAWCDMDTAMKEALGGKPDGVELVENGDFSDGLVGWEVPATTTLLNEQLVFNATPNGSNIRALSLSVLADVYVAVTFTLSDWVSGSVAGLASGNNGAPVSTNGTHIQYIKAGSAIGYSGLKVTSTATGTVSNISVQELLPAMFTLATVVTLGAGKTELQAIGSTNIISSNGTFYGEQYIGGNYLKAYDNVTALLLPLINNERGDRFSFITQTDETGANFRVGYMNITQGETAFTFSSWTVFEGSFDPLDALRFAFGTSVPIYIGHTQLWEEYVDESLIITEIAKYGWI